MSIIFPPRPDFYIGGVVPTELLIDRHDELIDAKRVLLERRENVLIVGKRRIGKTSFARKLRNEIETKPLLTVDVSLVTYDSQPTSFLREILLLLCYQVGDKVFHQTTSQMLAALGTSPRSLKGDFRTFFELYKLARSMTISKTQTSSMEAGLESPIVGKVSGGKQLVESNELTGLESIEFISIVEELMTICKKANYQSVVVFADEANRLTSDTNKEILSQYFDVFSSREVQFVFVGDTSLINYRLVEDIFGATIKLHAFDSIDHIHALLERYYRKLQMNYREVFSEQAVRKIWEISKGHPYLVQLLCSCAIDEAYGKGKPFVEDADIVFAWVQLVNKDRRLTELME